MILIFALETGRKESDMCWNHVQFFALLIGQSTTTLFQSGTLPCLCYFFNQFDNDWNQTKASQICVSLFFFLCALNVSRVADIY